MTAHAQDVYLCGCINTSAPKLVSSSSESHREILCVYTVSVSGEQTCVCKKAFQNLHVISEEKIFSHNTTTKARSNSACSVNERKASQQAKQNI